MARYNNLGKPDAGGGGGISTEIEPIGAPPKDRAVKAGAQAAGGGGGGAQEEAYGPTFRDVGHQQDITSRGMSSGQTEMMFSSDNAPQQIGTVAPGPGGANTWAPQDPSYTGRDARFLAADMDVTPPGRTADRAGLDPREMQTNIPGQTPDIYGSGGWWEHGGPPGTGGAEVEGTIPNYYNTDIETEKVAPPPGWKPPPPDAPQYPGTTPTNYYDPVEETKPDPDPDTDLPFEYTPREGADLQLYGDKGRTTYGGGGQTYGGGMGDARQSVLNQQGGGGGGGGVGGFLQCFSTTPWVWGGGGGGGGGAWGHQGRKFHETGLALQPRKFKAPHAHYRFKEQRRSMGGRALLHHRHRRQWGWKGPGGKNR
jgi:hypothetical protein